jgi:peroxisomal trans-2-enoyl-CoA reductase
LFCFVSFFQGSSIYSDTAAANYGSQDIFNMNIPGVPAKRLGTVEEVVSLDL